MRPPIMCIRELMRMRERACVHEREREGRREQKLPGVTKTLTE